MAEGFYRDVTRELSTLGYVKVKGGKGSHEKWANGQGTLLVVPRNLLSRHTANGILKDAGSERRV